MADRDLKTVVEIERRAQQGGQAPRVPSDAVDPFGPDHEIGGPVALTRSPRLVDGIERTHETEDALSEVHVRPNLHFGIVELLH